MWVIFRIDMSVYVILARNKIFILEISVIQIQEMNYGINQVVNDTRKKYWYVYTLESVHFFVQQFIIFGIFQITSFFFLT